MTSFLQAWWPLFLLIHMPWIASRVAHIMFARTKSRLDHATPDTLPETAGQWLERKLAALELGVQAIVTNDRSKLSLDAFHPAERTIQLTEDVYFKRDPAYWAIAAHELGHARFRLGRPRLSSAFDWCRRIEWVLVSVGLALGLGNMLYGLAHVTDAAFVILAVALGLHIAKIVNEMIASALAFAALEHEAHLTRAHLRTVRVVLFLALSTYLASFVGYALLLKAWPLVEANTTHAPLVLGTLTTFGGVMAIVWSVVVAISALGRFAKSTTRRWWPPMQFVFAVTQVLMLVALPSLLWLLWDARPEPAFALCVMLASVSTIRLITAAAAVMFTLPMLVLRRFLREAFRGIEGIGVERSDVFISDMAAGRELTKAGNAEIERMLKRAATRAKWGGRLITLFELPLLVMYWLL